MQLSWHKQRCGIYSVSCKMRKLLTAEFVCLKECKYFQKRFGIWKLCQILANYHENFEVIDFLKITQHKFLPDPFFLMKMIGSFTFSACGMTYWSSIESYNLVHAFIVTDFQIFFIYTLSQNKDTAYFLVFFTHRIMISH